MVVLVFSRPFGLLLADLSLPRMMIQSSPPYLSDKMGWAIPIFGAAADLLWL